jgi:hypothetical protein
MAKEIKLLVETNKNVDSQQYTITTQSIWGKKPLHLKAVRAAQYILQDPSLMDAGPDIVEVWRINQDLHVSLEGQKSADLVIEGFYDTSEGRPKDTGLFGRAEDGQTYSYIAEDKRWNGPLQDLSESEGVVSHVLGGAPYAQEFQLSSLTFAGGGGGGFGLGAGLGASGAGASAVTGLGAATGVAGTVGLASTANKAKDPVSQNQSDGVVTPPEVPAPVPSPVPTPIPTPTPTPVKPDPQPVVIQPSPPHMQIDSNALTNVATVEVYGVESDARWQYRVDGGEWLDGSATSFEASEGAHGYELRQIDVQGNGSEESARQHIILDTVAPEAPNFKLQKDTGNSSSDNITNNALIDVSLEEGATWQYRVDEGDWLDGLGTSFSAVSGQHSYEVRQVDAADNVSKISATQTITLDTNAPNSPSLTFVNDTGTQGDYLSNQAALSVAGLEANASWEYKVDQGDWQVGQGASIHAVEGVHDYEVRQTDVAGNASAPNSAQTLTLDTVAPNQPTFKLQQDTGNSSSDNITNNTLIDVSLEEGVTWQYRVDKGDWLDGLGTSFSAVAGQHSYEVRQIDIAGNASALSSAQTLTLDTVAPEAPNFKLQQDTGNSSADNITNNALIDVSLEEGATWQYRVDKGDWLDGLGTSFSAVAGQHSYEVRQIDIAGNASAPSSAQTLALDTVAPEVPNFKLQQDTGNSSVDNITNNALIDVSLEDGSTWQYRVDKGEWLDGLGTSFSAVAGQHSYEVRQVDAAGNVSKTSATQTITLDTNAPNAPSLSFAIDSGKLNDGISNKSSLAVLGLEANASWEYKIDQGNWQVAQGASFQATEGQHLYQVRQIDIAGNASAPSSAQTLTLDTVAPNQPTFKLQQDTGRSNSDGITNQPLITVGFETGAKFEYQVDGNGAWLQGGGTSFIAQSGKHIYVVRQTDAADNVSQPSAAQNITFDTTAPTPPSVSFVVDSGVLGDGVSNQATLNVNGLESGASWEYRIDNGSWQLGSGSTLQASSGSHEYILRQTDVAGNISNSSIMQVYTYDNIAPNAPAFTLHQDTGSSNTDGITSSPNIVVTLEAGASFQYQVDGAGAWLQGVGSSFDALVGTHTYALRQTDVAGNISNVSSSKTFQYQNTSPSALSLNLRADTGSSNTDHVTNQGEIDVSGSFDASNRWQYQIDHEPWMAGTSVHSLQAISGTHSYKVMQYNTAGTASAVTELTVTYDTQAPSVSVITSLTDNWQPEYMNMPGKVVTPTLIANGAITDDPWPDVYGKTEAYATVELAVIAYAGVGFTTEFKTNIQANANGDWTFNLGNSSVVVKPTMTYGYFATATDLAGNHNATMSERYNFIYVVNTQFVTPLAIDLNGDGVQTSDLSKGVSFDLRDLGASQHVAWLDANDAFLALDLNGDGVINSGAELFGDHTRLSDGAQAKDGWQALASYDLNLDGNINASDAVFEYLRLWRDANSDGKSTANEIYTLKDFGIEQINLKHDGNAIAQNGNVLTGFSNASSSDGKTFEITNVWFQAPIATQALNELLEQQMMLSLQAVS